MRGCFIPTIYADDPRWVRIDMASIADPAVPLTLAVGGGSRWLYGTLEVYHRPAMTPELRVEIALLQARMVESVCRLAVEYTLECTRARPLPAGCSIVDNRESRSTTRDWASLDDRARWRLEQHGILRVAVGPGRNFFLGVEWCGFASD